MEMTLEEYFKDKPRGAKSDLATALGISRTWLALIINHLREPSAVLCTQIEQLTEGSVTRADLRPDLFGKIR
jgi:DNA-binding transcriptional regulator YdaS (Cro superfamily)|tara:strand:+ start:150 stop:365 length:216 start_codon:yes stop_codon:yes gene_type:complete